MLLSLGRDSTEKIQEEGDSDVSRGLRHKAEKFGLGLDAEKHRPGFVLVQI